jgi:hypothetical protein
MLPPRLKQLKEALVTKGYQSRSTGEDELLEELEALDGSKKTSEAISESVKANEIQKHSAGVFGGPSGRCPCCGR